MTFSLDTTKKQAIALLNLSVRDTAGVPAYSTATGDNTYSAGELDRAGQSAATEIMRAIAETDGHPNRGLFTDPTALTHEGLLPAHLGSIGVPRITPYSGAGYTIIGKRKSVEEISAYRHNPNNMYSTTAHNAAASLGGHSKLAGFYAVDGETFYFTGFSAVSDLANFDESDYVSIPEYYYPTAIALQIANLKKDGDASDIFSYYEKQAMLGLQLIRAGQMDAPSLKKTIGTRDSGAK